MFHPKKKIFLKYNRSTLLAVILRNKIKIGLSLALLVLGFLILLPYIFATDNGNCSIGSTAWSEKAGFISFNGDGATPTYGVTVSSSALTGYAWGAQTGWISFSGDYTGGGSYGVLNDGAGYLSGYAWSEKAGLINFAATGSNYSNDSAANYGVYIDGSSNFQGYAWGAQTGWISFSGDYTGGGSYGVTTTWTSSPADSYWVGGDGSWSEAATHWALTSNGSADVAALPGATTNVHFDSNSGGGTATVDGAVSVATVVMDTGNTTAVTLGNTLTTTGNFTVTAGTLDPATYLTTIGGTFTVTDTIKVGASTFAGSYSVMPTLNAGSTVNYSLAGTQTVASTATMGSSYQNLTISGSGTKTLGGATTVAGDLTISAGTLDVSGTNYALNVAGNFTNSDTFTKQAGTVTFDGSSTQVINSGGSSFNNVTLSNNTFTLLTNAMTVAGNLVISEAKTPTITATTSEAFTVTGTTDGTNGGSVETLTVNTTGAVTFTGAVGTGDADMLTVLTITNSAALTFSGAASGATTGPNSPGTMATSNASGGTIDWTSPNNAKAADAVYTQALIGENPPACLSPDTLIATENGDKAIKDLEIGDLIYSYNFASGKKELKQVGNVASTPIAYAGNKYYRIYFGDSDVRATYDHLFYANDNFVPAESLKVGDILLDINGQQQLITKIDIEENYTDNVWELSVNDNHNFFANDALVHNEGIYDHRVRIIKGGAVGSTDKASGTAWPTSPAYTTYGGASDLWGETWTAEDINASTFGVAISAYASGYYYANNTSYYLKATNFGFAIPTGATINGITAEVKKRILSSAESHYAQIDHIRITVDYAPASSAVNITGALAQTNAATGTTTFSGAVTAGSVTLNGTTAQFGGTTAVTNLTSITPDQVIIFPQASTTTISGTLKLEGTTGHNILLKSDEAGDDGAKVHQARVDIAAVLDNHSNAYFQYVTPYDNDASNGAAQPIQQQNCVDGGNNSGWGFNTAPNAPTLVSPADASSTANTTPTLSANYSDPDAGDAGTTNYGIATSVENCLAQTFVSGCGGTCTGASSTTADEDEDTTWTPGSSIGSDATYYWCAQNNDGVATSSWTEMGSFVLDTSTPDIEAINAGPSSGDRTSLASDTWFNYSDTGSDDQISLSWTDPSSLSNDTFYYELNLSSGDTITGDESTTLTPYIDVVTITEGTSYFHVRPKNGAGTWGTERIFIVKYDTTAPETLTIDFPIASTKYNATTYAATPFSWTCTDSLSDCDVSTCEVYNSSDDDLGACLNYTPASDGDYTIKIKEQDNAGNEATSSTVSFTYDTAAPSSVTSDADGAWHTSAFDVTLNCADATSGCDKVYYCTNVYGDPTCTPDTNYVSPGSTFNFATQGEYVLRLKGVDLAGNATDPADETNHLKLDTTPPTITGITSVAGDSSAPYYDTTDNSSTLVVYTASADAATCKWNTTDVSYDSMSNTCASTTNCDLNLSGESAKTVYVRCQDIAGNKAASSYTLNYTIDATPPTQSAWNPASTSTIATATPTITLTLNENGDCKSSATDQAYASMSTDCSGDGTTSISCTTTSLAPDGAKDVYIACKDTAGNEDSIASNTKLSYTLDTTPPTTSNYSPSDGSTIVDTTPEITFDTNELGDCYISQTNYSYDDMVSNSQVDCVESGTTHTCQMTSLLPDGAKTIYIACEDWPMANKDTTGTTDNISYTLDTTPSTIVFSNDVASGPVISDTITVNWGDASVKKWEYDADGDCPTTSGSYSKTDGDSMDQDTQANNGKWICLYAEDAYGNKSTQASANDINIDATPPTIIGVTSSLDNGSYTIDQVVSIQVSFTEEVTVSGTPQLTLSTGSPSTTAVNYTSGSGASTITFNYTVVAGNTSTDLDYASTGALALNGGTIKDAVGNNATLTLASPGVANSLGANKALVIDTTNPIITVTNPNTDSAQSKTITAETNEGTLTMSNTTGADCDGGHGLIFITYASQTFTLESDNGTKVCYKAVDTATNTTYSLSNAIAGIDTTAPVLSFTDDVAAGPVISDTITGSWGDASVKKWEYDTDGVCSTTSGDYSKTDADSIDQTTETNNTKYICLYGEDLAGNKSTQASANDINIDATAPTVTFTDDVASGPVVSDTITGSWGDASTKLWEYDADGTCSTTSGDYSKTDADSIDQTTETNNTKYICLYGEDAVGNYATQVSANDINIDITVPANISVSSVTADSTTQLTVIASTATDSGSGLNATPYWFREIGGNDGVSSSSAWQASTTFTDTGLTPNTLYAYEVKAKDALDNASEYSDNTTKYTLAAVPGTPSLIADSTVQITASWSANSNPTGTYYYIENTTDSTNSGWITDASWASSGLACGTSYSFRVKARNGNLTSTDFSSTTSETTSSCGGGGLPAGAYNPPAPPVGTSFAVSINNGAASVATRDVMLTLTAGSNVVRMSISNDPNFTNAVQEPYSPRRLWTLTDGQGQKTVYAKFFTSYGVASNTVSDSINVVFEKQQQPAIPYPPLAESVPVQPQTVFRGGVIISQKELAKIAILPLPEPIKNLALKFPQFGQTLEKVGISKTEDVQKLQTAKLTFPGLAEASGAVEGLSLSKFTTKEITQMPTGFVFARTGANNIDFNTKVTISKLGEPIKTITTIQNKPLYLVVKPDTPAESVKGYVIFKSANSRSAFVDFTSKLSDTLSASLLDATSLRQGSAGQANLNSEVTATKDIVLSEFSYQDENNDGVWETTIQTPAVDGKYEIRTTISYPTIADEKQSTEELSMIMVVDPEGYIYEKIAGNKEARISDANVFIYWLNPDTNKYELWPAKDFQQENPQTTDITGKYSFLVPVGEYYLKVDSHDYLTYQGQPFKVTEGSGVHLNIEVKTKNWFLRLFTIERIMLGVIAIILLVIVIILLYLGLY